MVQVSMAYPGPSQCGNCHGLVHTDKTPLVMELGSDKNWGTETTGQIFSAQPMRVSGLNFSDKDQLGRAWDLHAQRLVECRDCHYAKTPPAHLLGGDAEAPQTSAVEGLRSCNSCHTGMQGHDWLPEQQKHFAAVACESCHVPQIHLPARKQVDASVVAPTGDYVLRYRGLEQGQADDLAHAYSTGYRPLLLKRPGADGAARFAPMNLVSRWYWLDADSQTEVDKELLKRVWLVDGDYRPQIIAAFDSNQDRTLDESELRLDSESKVELIRALLIEQGVSEPVLQAEIRAFHLHHSVALDEATRDCQRCHNDSKDVVFDLADYLPGGVLPSVFNGVSESLKSQWRLSADGSLKLVQPRPLAKTPVKTKEKP
jgi:hypothetical protein